jgi:abortive infection bacteriophage resistance protein
MVVNFESIVAELEKKGLVIKNIEEFEYYVKNFNVNTFLTGYSGFFSDENGVFQNTTSSDIIRLYVFDRNLGNHIFRNILIIEKIMNTRVTIETINHYDITDKCLLKMDQNVLRNSVFRNIGEVTPYVEFNTMLYRMVKYMDTNIYTKKLIDKNIADDVFK